MPRTENEERIEYLEEAIEALEKAHEALQLEYGEDEYMRRTIAPQLEGKEAGWLGDNFAIDQLRSRLHELQNSLGECEECGGLGDCEECG